MNTHEGAGHNIPCDLHNEHINRSVREILINMGANITETAVRRACQSVSMTSDIVNKFDEQSGVPKSSNVHSTKSDDEDVMKIVTVLRENAVFSIRPGRAHSTYPGMTVNPLFNLGNKRVLEWIIEKQLEQLRFRILPSEDYNIDDNYSDA